jgi:hypothetical protein
LLFSLELEMMWLEITMLSVIPRVSAMHAGRSRAAAWTARPGVDGTNSNGQSSRGHLHLFDAQTTPISKQS